MTASWVQIDHHLIDRIMNEAAGVNRVFYDVSSKPSATIERE